MPLAVVFPLGPESYALPLEQVREIVATPGLTVLPTAPPAVLGLANLRGDVLPVMDLGRLVGSPFAAAPDFVMVVDTPRGAAGLAASGLPRIVDVDSALESDQAIWAGGVHSVDGRPVVSLDLPALLETALAAS